jgi:two-component system, NarL family, nitrate/nitrite response regulator NarL
MRIVLVGAPAERARLRAELNGSMRVLGEFDTLAEARRSHPRATAVLAAPGGSETSETSEASEAFEEALTAREIQVLERLAEGLPNKAIAARLGISDQTVKFHVASIAGKLGAANRTDAVRRAVRRGLISL